MGTFLIGAALMIVAAYVLILPVLFKRNIEQSIDQDAVNLELGRERLKELEADQAAGKLDQETFERLRDELERSLLQTIDLDKKSEQVQTRSNPMALILLILLIPLIALGVYLNTGSRLALDDQARAAFIAEQQEPGTPDVQAMVAQLAERLEAEPNDGEGWWMLGRSYMVMGQLEKASDAFAQALPLQEDNADLLADYADTLGRLNNTDLTGKAKPLILRAYELNPNQQKVRWLSGVLAFQEGRYGEVAGLMQTLLDSAEENSEIYNSIKGLIDEAAKRGQTDQIKAGMETTVSEANETASIEVTVTLAEEIQKSLNGDEAVFVFARAVSGPPMPLAAIKLNVSELPKTVVLDDSLAMRPGMGISAHENVMVLARVSMNGDPIAASGDSQGMVESVATQKGTAVSVVIDQVLP